MPLAPSVVMPRQSIYLRRFCRRHSAVLVAFDRRVVFARFTFRDALRAAFRSMMISA